MLEKLSNKIQINILYKQIMSNNCNGYIKEII